LVRCVAASSEMEGPVAVRIPSFAGPSGHHASVVPQPPHMGLTTAAPNASEVTGRERSVSMCYGRHSFSFGWRDGTLPKDFAAQLRDAVRYSTGLVSLDGIELQATFPGDDAPRRVTPRDIFEGRISPGLVVRVEIVDASLVAAAAANPARAAASSPPSSANPTPYAPLVASAAVGPYPAQTPLPTERFPPAVQIPISGAALSKAGPQAAPPRAKREPREGSKYAKKGGSQLQFVQMMSGNQSPLSRLPKDLKLTPEEVAKHNTSSDCWTIFQGRVYDVSLYMDFHPGGKGELMKGAGIDSTDIFLKAHQWVSAEGLIGKLCLGPVVPQ